MDDNETNKARIEQARNAFLQRHPFDPHQNAVMGQDADGNPAGFMTFPDMGELGILGCKLGMEYLAICHDEEAVEEWINTCLSLARSPEMAGILFANVFRGINVFLGTVFADRGLTEAMASVAVESWEREF